MSSADCLTRRAATKWQQVSAHERDSKAAIRRRGDTPIRREAGFTLVEMSVALFLLTAVATFTMRTIASAWLEQNWSILQSMTDARAGIETAYAQRWIFAAINSSNVESIPDPNLTITTPYTLWPVYPNYASSQAVIGQGPVVGQTSPAQVTATVVRTCHSSTDPVTGAQSYLLESYVVYQENGRKYCKVSKVYREQ